MSLLHRETPEESMKTEVYATVKWSNNSNKRREDREEKKRNKIDFA